MTLLPWALVSVALMAVALFAAPSLAHMGAPEGRFPFVTSEGLIGGGTTWGIVRKEDGRWMRVCEEAIEQPPAFYYRRSDGSLLVARTDGVFHTDDDGCTLNPGPAVFVDRRPALLAVPAERPATLIVGTSLSIGGNGLYISHDEGETFAPTALVEQDASLRSLVVSADGSDIYAAAIDLDTREPVVFVSRDGGESFTPKAPWTEGVATANVVGRDPDTGEIALVLLDPAAPGSTLALADAALESLTVLESFTGVVSDFVVHDDAWLVIESRQRYYRRAKSEGEFVQHDEGPTRCLLKFPGDERVWGCGQPFQDGHFLVSDDGVRFEPEMTFLSIEERRCPDGTLGADRCSYLWEPDGGVVEPKRDAGSTTPPPRVERPGEETPPGSSCASTGGRSLSVVLLLGLVGGFGLLRRVSAPARARARPRRSA